MTNLRDMSIQYLKGVGPSRKKMFERLGVETVEDLLYFFPRTYEDRRNLVSIAQVRIGETQTIVGSVKSQFGRRSYFNKKHLTEVVLDDGSGRMTCVWFNQPYLDKYFQKGAQVVCYGKVDRYKNRLQMVSPEYEIIDEEQSDGDLKQIVPVYPLTRGMTQRYIRKIMASCLDKYLNDVADELPVAIRNKHRLANIKRCLNQIHFPPDFKDQEEAVRRVSFEEFFFYQLSMTLRRLSITEKNGVSHRISQKDIETYMNGFPFPLTGAQQRVIRELSRDLQNSHPMLRLLQGDVGSGKTLMALFGCYVSSLNGFQSCLMAPTEILAKQHYENIRENIHSGPLKGMSIACLVSSMEAKEKRVIQQKISRGELDCVIGTHALISENVKFKNLSYVVIDEQHKFGVRQRSLLAEKGDNPDVLLMTATPIPRTLCITMYGDLEVSILDEMPPGRGRIETVFIPEDRMEDAYKRIRQELRKGQQAYVIYPIVEESETVQLRAAEEMAKQFQKDIFKEYKVGLVHGRMKKSGADKEMARFKDKKIDILVATTIIEVGIDVPNANVMLIEHAERFGLSQLHQLRGRIGRGGKDGLCLLSGNTSTDEAAQRIQAICATQDGFKIAEKDLEIRGPGQYFGRHQHGLSELRVADPSTQMDILELARKEARGIVAADPTLSQKSHQRLKDLISRRYPAYLSMVQAG